MQGGSHPECASALDPCVYVCGCHRSQHTQGLLFTLHLLRSGYYLPAVQYLFSPLQISPDYIVQQEVEQRLSPETAAVFKEK